MSRRKRFSKTAIAPDSPKSIPPPRRPLMSHSPNILCPPGFSKPLPLPSYEYNPQPPRVFPPIPQYTPVTNYLSFLQNPYVWGVTHPLSEGNVYNITESFRYFPR
jgi:hypothetical protein